MSTAVFTVGVLLAVGCSVGAGILSANWIISVFAISSADAWKIHALAAGMLTLGIAIGAGIMIFHLLHLIKG